MARTDSRFCLAGVSWALVCEFFVFCASPEPERARRSLQEVLAGASSPERGRRSELGGASSAECTSDLAGASSPEQARRSELARASLPKPARRSKLAGASSPERARRSELAGAGPPERAASVGRLRAMASPASGAVVARCVSMLVSASRQNQQG